MDGLSPIVPSFDRHTRECTWGGRDQGRQMMKEEIIYSTGTVRN